MTESELRSAFVSTAKGYIGTVEGSGRHRAIVDLYNGHRPLARGYALKYTDAWCAGFVSAMAIQAGLEHIIPPEVGCGHMMELYRAAGRWVEEDGHVPKPGDVIFYDWQDDGKGDCQGSPDHVGIVADVGDGLICVIEGNLHNAVGERRIAVGQQFIRGYGVPDYASLATAEPFTDVDTGAWYASDVAEAAELGIVEGVGGGRFEPERAVTRAEAAAMVMRLYKLLA